MQDQEAGSVEMKMVAEMVAVVADLRKIMLSLSQMAMESQRQEKEVEAVKLVQDLEMK